MKHAFAVFAMLVAAPAFAQTAPAPAPSPAPSEPQAASPGEAEAGGTKALRVSCREEAKAKDLKGMDRRQAVSACVVAKRPDLAGREQCRTDGFAKGLRQQELHAFVKDCAKSKG